MKPWNLNIIVTTLTAAVLCCAAAFSSGCSTTTTVDPATGKTNAVTQVDPARLTEIRQIIEPGASSVLRRAIARSPQHAQEIADYAGAISSIFCQMQASGNFSVDYLVAAADKATAQLQAKAASSGAGTWVEDVIDGKNVLLGVYKAAAGNALTWQVPGNVWLKQVTALICDSVTQALNDAGVKPSA